MHTRPLGNSGLNVGCIGLGAMPLSVAGRPEEKDAIRVIHAALDSGITLIDTADVYCLGEKDIGHNERLIAKALKQWKGRRDSVVVATKGGLERPGGDWVRNGDPKHLKAACDKSLKALGVDSIALYQYHAPDEKVPFADSVGALADLKKKGKIRNVGLSNVDVKRIQQAEKIVPIASVQNACSVFDRKSITDGVVAHCEARGIAFLPYSTVGGHRNHARTRDNPTLKMIADRHDATPYQVCLAWLLALSPSVIPIPGASRVASATSSAAAAELKLTPHDLDLLNRFLSPA